MKLTVNPASKEVTSGQTITALLLLQNLGLRGTPVDVSVALKVVDLDKNVLIQSSKEVIRVIDDVYTRRELNIPSSTPVGKYLVIGELGYEGITVEVYDTFDVVGEAARVEIPLPTLRLNTFVLAIALLVLILVMVIVLLRRKRRRMKKSADETLQRYYQMKAGIDKSMPQLIEYIRKEAALGYPKEWIVQTLVTHGWPKAVVVRYVEEVFKERGF